MDKISIIVPVYNVEKYLEKCINSIINQTYQNLEIILIDDGSIDYSSKICDIFAEKDNRIRVIHKENEGVSVTKNLGIKISTGSYISFVDSDDYIDPRYIETLYKNLIECDADISTLSYKVIRKDGTIIQTGADGLNMQEDEIAIYEDIDIIKELLKQKTIKNFVCKLYKKSILCEFPVGVNYEDIIFSFEVLRKAKRVVYQNSCFYNYLKRKGSITATITEKNLIDFGNAIFDRYTQVKNTYPSLQKYNMYAFFESTMALSIKSVICDQQYSKVNDKLEEFLTIIKDYTKANMEEFLPLLNDYQKLCLYLIMYNTYLYYYFLKERQRLKVLGKL